MLQEKWLDSVHWNKIPDSKIVQEQTEWSRTGPNLGYRSFLFWFGWIWTKLGLVLVNSGCSWLTCGHAIACLWFRSGKQQWTTQVPSLHAVCGPHEGVWCGPDMCWNNFAIWVAYWVFIATLMSRHNRIVHPMFSGYTGEHHAGCVAPPSCCGFTQPLCLWMCNGAHSSVWFIRGTTWF